MSTNDPMTQDQLDAIRERLEVRTSGPWRAIICESADHPPHGNGVIASGSSWPVVDDETMRAEDADLIAHAPQDLADLLAEVERLRALTTVDDDMVERAAKALFLSSSRTNTESKWERFPEVIRESWRIDARAALDAAHNSGEGS